MPETTDTSPARTPRPSERDLRKALDADVRRGRELLPKLRAKGVTDDELCEAREISQRVRTTRRELNVRAAENESGLRTLWHRNRRSYPLARARELEHPVLDGIALDAKLLADEEVEELRDLLRVRNGDEETPEQSARYEVLVGKAAGEPDVLARRRDDLEREDEMRAEATKLARAFLPVRRDPEPGSVELPRFVFDWLTNGRADTFDVGDLGLLAALVFSFANESGALFAHGRFEGVGDDPRIVVGKEGGSLRLAAGATTRSGCRFARTSRA